MSPSMPSSPETRKTAILAIILVSYIMIVLDISVVLTGLPMIHAQVGFSEANLAWVQSAYTLTFGGFLLLGARVGDILGRQRMFVAGLALFTLASLAIGASQTAAWMLSWRAIEGVGAAVLVLGGVLAQNVSWRAGLCVNLPIGIGPIVSAHRFTPETARDRGGFDLGGAFTSIAAMVGWSMALAGRAIMSRCLWGCLLASWVWRG